MIESPRTFWLTLMMKSVQTSETPPITSVETLGVRCFGLIFPKALGIDPKRAIDRVVRAVGRIVVWVDAEADVSTVMIRSLSSGEPSTGPPREARTSFLWCVRPSVPAKAWAEAATTT